MNYIHARRFERSKLVFQEKWLLPCFYPGYGGSRTFTVLRQNALTFTLSPPYAPSSALQGLHSAVSRELLSDCCENVWTLLPVLCGVFAHAGSLQRAVRKRFSKHNHLPVKSRPRRTPRTCSPPTSGASTHSARACLRRASFVCERVSALVALTCSSEIQ